MSSYVGAMLKSLGYRFLSQTSHPAMIFSRNKSTDWKMIAKPNMHTKTLPLDFPRKDSGKSAGHAKRLRATFEYVGPGIDPTEARQVWDGE